MGRNPILHSYDYVTNEGPRTDNRDVITENKKNKKNLAALQWINTPESEALYNFLSHPLVVFPVSIITNIFHL